MATKVTSAELEVAFLNDDPDARVTKVAIEAIIGVISRSPATPTGAGASQVVVEAALLTTSPYARVTQEWIEVAYIDTSVIGPGGEPAVGTTSFAFAV